MKDIEEKEDLCDECSFHRKLTFSEAENLWLCDTCSNEES
jgi:ribosomal protein L37AE/L43A